MSDRNKALARRDTQEIWNKGNLAAIDEIFAETFLRHDPSNPEEGGLDGYRQFVAEGRAGFPDVHITIEDIISEGDKVVVRVAIDGTHQGKFMGIEPTGKKMSVTGMSFYKIQDDKIVELWDNWDALGMMQQLGAIP